MIAKCRKTIDVLDTNRNNENNDENTKNDRCFAFFCFSFDIWRCGFDKKVAHSEFILTSRCCSFSFLPISPRGEAWQKGRTRFMLASCTFHASFTVAFISCASTLRRGPCWILCKIQFPAASFDSSSTAHFEPDWHWFWIQRLPGMTQFCKRQL